MLCVPYKRRCEPVNVRVSVSIRMTFVHENHETRGKEDCEQKTVIALYQCVGGGEQRWIVVGRGQIRGRAV